MKMLDKEIKLRRVMDGEVLRRVSALNRRYEENDFCGCKEGEQNYKIITGKIPVLVSAPHAVRQWRDGKMKERDGMTGGLAEYLCEKFGTWGIVRRWLDGDDPNYGDDERSAEYRNAIVDLVREQKIVWVFDVHGCLNKYGFDLDLGVNGGKNLACSLSEAEILAQCWRDLGLDVRIDGQFRACGPRVVSKYVHDATGINCLQMELNSKMRTTDAGLVKFCDGFEKVISILYV